MVYKQIKSTLYIVHTKGFSQKIDFSFVNMVYYTTKNQFSLCDKVGHIKLGQCLILHPPKFNDITNYYNNISAKMKNISVEQVISFSFRSITKKKSLINNDAVYSYKNHQTIKKVF